MSYLGAVALFELRSSSSAVAPTMTAFIVGESGRRTGHRGYLLRELRHRRVYPATAQTTCNIRAVWRVVGRLSQGRSWVVYSQTMLPGDGAFISTRPSAGRQSFLRVSTLNNPSGESFFTRVLHLDLVGSAVLVPSVIMLLLALQWGGLDYPWSDSRIIGLFVGVVLAPLSSRAWRCGNKIRGICRRGPSRTATSSLP